MRQFTLCSLLFLLVAGHCVAQQTSKIQVGLEQDILPYVTGGYFGGVWVGKNHVRLRAITARVHKPDFVIANGFTNNKVTAYAMLVDYFPNDGWSGWWVGGGMVYWKSSIQGKEKLGIANFKNYMLNGSMGYNWKWKQWFYLGPWAGMHFRIGGVKEISVDGKTYTPPLLNPEASVKVGWIIH